MRLSMILGVCIVLCGAMIAQADLVDITYGATTYSQAISYTRTANVTSGVDELQIYFASNGITTMDPGQLLQLFEGNFVTFAPLGAPGSGTLRTLEGVQSQSTRGTANPDPEGDGDWIDYTNRGYRNADLIPNFDSFVNFPTSNGALTPSSLWVETTSSLAGSWYTSSNGTKLGNNGLIAQLYVASNDGVTFTGTSGWGGWGFSGSGNLHGNFTIPAVTTPEPSILLLAASGLIGLLCYAWRKRRS